MIYFVLRFFALADLTVLTDITDSTDNMSIKVKICGITNISDAESILKYRPDFFGFIMYPKSPRYIKPNRVRDIVEHVHRQVRAVGVFVNEAPENVLHYARLCHFDFVQLHGDETQEDISFLKVQGLRVIKAFRLKDETVIESARDFMCRFLLFDAFRRDQYGGTGETINQDLLTFLSKDDVLQKRRIFLSGGLHSGNVREVVSHFYPYAVDASSQLESAPGIKDIAKVKAFIEEVRSIPEE
ncbi:MAG: phosphoribosylanthranilate isomerase [Candidatus Aureabacteria bacterium]|nr:phosphoribosylanthranilate isomerase [Candidatus Auribacterota bacterium]